MRFNTFKTTVAAIAVAMCLNLCRAEIYVDLVQNGTFSSFNGLSIPGWDTPGGYWWGAFGGVTGGSFAGIGGSFTQTLNTQAGLMYSLQFYISTAIGGESQTPGPYGLSVTWDSQNPISYTFTQQTVHWNLEQLQVIAYSSQTVLTFSRIYGPIPFLDNVSVTPIAIP